MQGHISTTVSLQRFVGRWSRAVRGAFLDWLAPPTRVRWLDVGCGGGAFTELVVDTCEPSTVTAVDPAEGQIDYVRRKPVAARSSVRAALLRLRRAHRGKRFFQCVNLRLHGGELRA